MGPRKAPPFTVGALFRQVLGPGVWVVAAEQLMAVSQAPPVLLATREEGGGRSSADVCER